MPNGDFSDGLTGWQLTDNGNAFFQATDGALCITFPTYGTATLGTTGPLYLSGAVVYEFSYRAWSNIAMSSIYAVRAKVGEAAPPYTPYAALSPIPTSSPDLYSQVFQPPGDVTAGVAFVLYVNDRGTVCFDDVAVRIAPP